MLFMSWPRVRGTVRRLTPTTCGARILDAGPDLGRSVCGLVMDDRRMLLLSILYRLLCSLLGVTAVLMRRDLSKDVELLVLRQENIVLRRQVSRVRYMP